MSDQGAERARCLALVSDTDQYLVDKARKAKDCGNEKEAHGLYSAHIMLLGLHDLIKSGSPAR